MAILKAVVSLIIARLSINFCVVYEDVSTAYTDWSEVSSVYPFDEGARKQEENLLRPV